MKKPDITYVVSDLNNVAGKIRFTYYKAFPWPITNRQSQLDFSIHRNQHLLAAKYQPIPASQPTIK